MTAIEEIAFFKAELATAQGVIEASKGQADETTSALAALTAERDKVAGELAAAVAEHAETVKAYEAAQAEAQAKADALATELAEAKGRLRNPAFAPRAESDPVPGGAEAAAPAKTAEEWQAEYNALPSKTADDHRARAQFRKDHKAELGL